MWKFARISRTDASQENCQWCGEFCFVDVAVSIVSFCHKFLGGTDNHSVFHRGYSLREVLHALALASTVSMCSLHAIFLSKIHIDIIHYLHMQYYVHSTSEVNQAV
jgi:hypothetical protein